MEDRTDPSFLETGRIQIVLPPSEGDAGASATPSPTARPQPTATNPTALDRPRLDSDPMDAPPLSTSSPTSGAGRYAPSPSGDLHLGNLRTAILAWILARRTGRAFHLRIEDLDRVQEGSEQRQLEDLAALGLDWDG